MKSVDQTNELVFIFILIRSFFLKDPDDNRHRPVNGGGSSRVDQERQKKLEVMERKQRELDEAKRDEERILREVGSFLSKFFYFMRKENKLSLSKS